MPPSPTIATNWKTLFRVPGFPYFFIAMLVSLFGTGMNYAGVTWYVLDVTNSTEKVSLVVILVTLPGLVVPPFGGVLIDRMDRRTLGIVLDSVRAVIVLGTAGLAYAGRLAIWELYTMVLLLGVGFAVYWATANALLQEIVPEEQLLTANAGVLIAVQGGMAAAGALVGFIFERTGVAGVLAIDGTTYLISAICLLLSHRYHPSSDSKSAPPQSSPSSRRRPGRGIFADMIEGILYLRRQPSVFALGITYSCMMAGVISANVLVVALVKDLLSAGPRGYGFIESGWALGAVAGGLLAGWVTRKRPYLALVLALSTLAVGHALFPYARLLSVAVGMNALFGLCRALGGIITQSAIMTTVPRRLMGRTQSAFAVIATLLQVTMSFALGWFAQHDTLSVAFVMLGLIYTVAVGSALTARSLVANPQRTEAS